ncbi:MAG: helix-turn-helix domain-containing protein [Dysgonamonadaceae bacterium]
MRSIETIKDFYDKMSIPMNALLNGGIGHFNVFQRQLPSVTSSYTRRDFYKITLIIGTGIVHYGDTKILVDKPAIFFSNPSVPYSWQAISETQNGWFCLFSEEFMQSFNDKVDIQDYPMFRLEGNPLVFLDEDSLANISYLFNRMVVEKENNYIYKYSKQNNYLQLLIHEALGLYPNLDLNSEKFDAAHRITLRFLELLGKQFPVESPQAPLSIRSSKDFADLLHIHVNHLNRSVKKVTGKSPSCHIIVRIVAESKSLLIHTNWSVAEVAFTLGFEYPSHFTAFLKTHTGQTPKQIRKDRAIV